MDQNYPQAKVLKIANTIKALSKIFIFTSFYEGMYDLFTFHSKPIYIWQYISGTFMHGSKEAPIWFLWVHLILNCLMRIPFGSILENKLGSKNTFIAFIVAMIISSLLFQVITLPYSEDIVASGISAIGYAFVTGGIMNMKDLWKKYSIKTKGLYIILISLSLIMLLPIITGWMSTLMHLSGIISYFIVYITIRHFKITER